MDSVRTADCAVPVPISGRASLNSAVITRGHKRQLCIFQKCLHLRDLQLPWHLQPFFSIWFKSRITGFKGFRSFPVKFSGFSIFRSSASSKISPSESITFDRDEFKTVEKNFELQKRSVKILFDAFKFFMNIFTKDAETEKVTMMIFFS